MSQAAAKATKTRKKRAAMAWERRSYTHTRGAAKSLPTSQQPVKTEVIIQSVPTYHVGTIHSQSEVHESATIAIADRGDRLGGSGGTL